MTITISDQSDLTMATCIWTNEDCENVKAMTVDAPDRLGRNPSPKTVLVCPEHEADVRAYVADVRQHGTTMIILVFVLTALLVGASLLPVVGAGEFVLPVTGVGCVLMGAVMYRLPFPTPETIDMLGIRRSVSLTRGLGILLALIGGGLLVSTIGFPGVS